VKTKQLLTWLVAAAALSALIVGCKQDSTAVQALQELTATQVNQAKKQNQELTSLAEQLGNCQASIAKIKDEPEVIKMEDAGVELPTLAGEPTVESLDAYKAELEKTLAAQESQLVDLRSKVESCTQDLSAAEEAKADAEKAAVDEAAEDAAKAAKEKARRKAAAEREKANAKPKAVKQAEEQGKATQGPRSRY
jgi:peptidoglycan hydrolase CwlO-like protein